MSTEWMDYHLHVGDVPNQLVVGCLHDYVTRKEASLDLGAGNLRDSRFLLKNGFKRVVAVDSCEDSRAFLIEGIEFEITPIETYVPEKDSFDFAFSCNTLFFLGVDQVATVFQNVLQGLRSGGVFACNVLGEEDDWVVQGQKVSYFDEKTLATLLDGFEILGAGESKKQSQSLNSHGMLVGKFWHQMSIAVRKP